MIEKNINFLTAEKPLDNRVGAMRTADKTGRGAVFSQVPVEMRSVAPSGPRKKMRKRLTPNTQLDKRLGATETPKRKKKGSDGKRSQ